MGEPAEHGLLMVDINIFHVYHQNRDVMSIYIYIHIMEYVYIYICIQ